MYSDNSRVLAAPEVEAAGAPPDDGATIPRGLRMAHPLATSAAARIAAAVVLDPRTTGLSPPGRDGFAGG
jgi:hypothetical protein